MNMPWHDKSGLPKAAAVFAALLLVSIGLCGVNFLGFTALSSFKDGAGPGAGWKTLPLAGLTVTGVVEWVGMIVGAVGLVVVAIAWAVNAIVQYWKYR